MRTDDERRRRTKDRTLKEDRLRPTLRVEDERRETDDEKMNTILMIIIINNDTACNLSVYC